MLDQDFPIEVILDLELPYPDGRPTSMSCRLKRTYESYTMGLCFLPGKDDEIPVGGRQVIVVKRSQRGSTVVLMVSLELPVLHNKTMDGRRWYYEQEVAFLKHEGFEPVE